MVQRRVSVLLDEARYRKVTRQAAWQGISVAAVIREAIDRMPGDRASCRRAADAILAAEPMPLPADPADLRAELDAAHEGTAPRLP